jgi:hypothetical protein
MGGCEGEAIYIDSEGSLVAKRLIEMAQSLLPLWGQAGQGMYFYHLLIPNHLMNMWEKKRLLMRSCHGFTLFAFIHIKNNWPCFIISMTFLNRIQRQDSASQKYLVLCSCIGTGQTDRFG